jgi:hypothetical protein
MRITNFALALATLTSVTVASTAEAKFLSVDPVQFDPANPNPAHFNRYSYGNNDPINKWDPFGLCASEAGQLVDCPTVTQLDDGVMMQGAEFNGLKTNFVSADNIETLNSVVGEMDSMTSTQAGQDILVGGQQANNVSLIVVVDSGQVTATANGSQGTFTSSSTGPGGTSSVSFVDTNDILHVNTYTNTSPTTGHSLPSGIGVATFGEKLVHEVVHGTNPNANEHTTQVISNMIHRERNGRSILHGG